MTRITHFGEQSHSWNVETDGMPGVGLFGNALQVWCLCQNRDDITVNDAALAFQVNPTLIRKAVTDHYWMHIIETENGEVIEHDGE